MTDRKNGLSLAAAGAVGGLSVALGAFGAHGLEGRFSADAAGWFATATTYALPHAAAAIALSLAGIKRAAWAMIIGALLFSGSLYLLALSSLSGAPVRALGMVTPIGGVSFLIGWGLTIAEGLRRR